jgi:hypothetical protein
MASPTTVIDAGTGEVLEGPLPATGTALVGSFNMDQYVAALIAPKSFEQQHKLMQVYDQLCRQLIGPDDIQREGNREFKKKSAWRKLSRAFGLSVHCDQADCRFIMMEDTGEWVVVAKASATAPWGQTWEDVGACGSDEETGRRKITYADAIGTAMTRASNRAVSNLIAMGEVSAEEMQKEPEKKPGDMLMPIGKRKGDPIGGIDTPTLQNALDWIESDEARKKRYARLVRTIQEVLDERGPPQQEQPSPEQKAEAIGQTTLPIDPNDPRVPPPDNGTTAAEPEHPAPHIPDGYTTSETDGLPFD